MPVARFLRDYGRLRRGLQPRQSPIYLDPAEYRLRWVAALMPDYRDWIERTCVAHPHETDEEREVRYSRYWHRFWDRSDKLDSMAENEPQRLDKLMYRFERRHGAVLTPASIFLEEQ